MPSDVATAPVTFQSCPSSISLEEHPALQTSYPFEPSSRVGVEMVVGLNAQGFSEADAVVLTSVYETYDLLGISGDGQLVSLNDHITEFDSLELGYTYERHVAIKSTDLEIPCHNFTEPTGDGVVAAPDQTIEGAEVGASGVKGCRGWIDLGIAEQMTGPGLIFDGELEDAIYICVHYVPQTRAVLGVDVWQTDIDEGWSRRLRWGATDEAARSIGFENATAKLTGPNPSISFRRDSIMVKIQFGDLDPDRDYSEELIVIGKMAEARLPPN